jgi:hypothetical protein
MSSLVKNLNQTLNKDVSSLHASFEVEKNIIKDDFKELGQYVLFGGVIGSLIFVPYVNIVIQKIPDAIVMAAKII